MSRGGESSKPQPGISGRSITRSSQSRSPILLPKGESRHSRRPAKRERYHFSGQAATSRGCNGLKAIDHDRAMKSRCSTPASTRLAKNKPSPCRFRRERQLAPCLPRICSVGSPALVSYRSGGSGINNLIGR